jgi:hypothetical protein
MPIRVGGSRGLTVSERLTSWRRAPRRKSSTDAPRLEQKSDHHPRAADTSASSVRSITGASERRRLAPVSERSQVVIAHRNLEVARVEQQGRDEATPERGANRHVTHVDRRENRHDPNVFLQTGVGADAFQRTTACSSPLTEDFLLIFPAATFLLFLALTVVLL